jgi:hypothetical protein
VLALYPILYLYSYGGKGQHFIHEFLSDFI